MIDARINKLTQPTFILWGKEDRIMDPSMAEVFANSIPNSEKVVLDGVGHVPMIETPRKSARAYLRFLGKQKQI